ncbi:MAG: sporulation peptidase YabG [Heliobacteriaceae bacterium]|nr:sporulation peptidase YabG [Heliobacteriaceae bacterium]MDD4587628.1 sporulation peptidase YabG [Heliobacteriaceae bacterium]
MDKIRVGDIVSRTSYGNDIYFRVIKIRQGATGPEAVLQGLDMRLEADAPLQDLEVLPVTEVFRYKQRLFLTRHHLISRIISEHHKTGLLRNAGQKTDTRHKLEYMIPGAVLHIDGNAEYLELCLNTYKQLGLKAWGFHHPETDFPRVIGGYLEAFNPDILVITGHDSFFKGKVDFHALESYRHSHLFIEAVRVARKVMPGRDDLVIFAGACQSNYEALLTAGANFASSPHRIMIHALDPVFIAERIAYTPVNEYIELKDLIDSTITGGDGIGGIATRGRLRWGYPRSPY